MSEVKRYDPVADTQELYDLQEDVVAGSDFDREAAHNALEAQHHTQGEPMAWMFKYLSHSDSPPYSSFEVTDFHQNPKAPGIEKHTPLYAEQPSPVVELPERLQQVLKFLDGSGELDGCSFGDQRPGYAKFWWRLHLRACLDEVTRLNTK